MPVADRSG